MYNTVSLWKLKYIKTSLFVRLLCRCPTYSAYSLIRINVRAGESKTKIMPQQIQKKLNFKQKNHFFTYQ